MAKIVKTIFEVAEEVAYKKAYDKEYKIAFKEGIEIDEAKANQKIRNAIRALVQTSSWSDEQIAEVM
jgi:hypothetical protein